MPRVISGFNKEQEKAATAEKRPWTKERRARFLRDLRSGALRIWAADGRLHLEYNPKTLR